MISIFVLISLNRVLGFDVYRFLKVSKLTRLLVLNMTRLVWVIGINGNVDPVWVVKVWV